MQLGLWEEKLGNCCRVFFVAGVCNNPKLNVPCTCYCQQYFRMRHFTVYSFVGEGKQLEMSSHSRFPHLHFGALSTSLSQPLSQIFKISHYTSQSHPRAIPDCRKKPEGKTNSKSLKSFNSHIFLYPSYHYQISCFGRDGNSTQLQAVN